MCGMICGRGGLGKVFLAELCFFWLNVLSFGKSFCRRGWYCFLQKTGRESERVRGRAVEGGCAVSRFGLAEGLLVEPFARSHGPSAWAVGIALRGLFLGGVEECAEFSVALFGRHDWRFVLWDCE